MSQSSLSFSLQHPVRYGPRLGSITLKRNVDTASSVTIATPGLFAGTSRGAVPHLSRDHVRITEALRWVNIPFESFLDQTPPIPVLHAQHPSNAGNAHPLHTFLGFDASAQLLSLSARDPNDTHEMPTNGNALVCVQTLRGVRKLAPAEWAAYARVVQPDVVLALSDTPLGGAPFSQKRLTKSIERSAAWLAVLLRPGPLAIPKPVSKKQRTQPKAEVEEEDTVALPPTPPVLVHLAGLTSLGARRAFASSLLEPLYGPDIAALAPLKTLDEGVAGYTFDLAPLKAALAAPPENQSATEAGGSEPAETPDARAPTHAQLTDLLRASLEVLPPTKPRLVTGATSPHEVLRLLTDVGADMFDARWAQRAADVGVALDYTFPVRRGGGVGGAKKEIGHNLYDVRYRLDFGCMSDALPAPSTSTSTSSFSGASSTTTASSFPLDPNTPISNDPSTETCPCLACTPRSPPTRLYHGHDSPSASHQPEKDPQRALPAYTRAYVHHLLHTHEMSAHALLAAHNLAVVDAFFAGIREVLARSGESAAAEGVDAGVDSESLFGKEVRAFEEAYDSNMGVLVEAEACWRTVDMARGKGRLAREKGPGEDEVTGGELGEEGELREGEVRAEGV